METTLEFRQSVHKVMIDMAHKDEFPSDINELCIATIFKLANELLEKNDEGNKQDEWKTAHASRSYQTIVPSEMNQDDLSSIIAKLYTAKNWGADGISVALNNGHIYNIHVDKIHEYRKFKKTHTGAINS